MKLDRVLAYSQSVGDGFIWQTFGQKAQSLAFPLRQLGKRARCGYWKGRGGRGQARVRNDEPPCDGS